MRKDQNPPGDGKMFIRRVLTAGEPQKTFCGREDKPEKRTEKQSNKNAIKSTLTFSCWKHCRQPSCLPIEDVPVFFFLSSVKDRNICALYGQSEQDQATAGGKRGGVIAFGRPCPLLPFVLSMPGEQGDISGILF